MSNRVRETEERQQEQVRKDRQNTENNRAKQKAGQQSFQQQMRTRNQNPNNQRKTENQAQTPTPQPQTATQVPKNALHARQGIQSKHFQSVFEQRGTENLTTTRKSHQDRGVETEDSSRTEQALLRELDRLEQEHPRVQGPTDDNPGQTGQQSGQQGHAQDQGHQNHQGDHQVHGVNGPAAARGSSSEAALKANAIKALVDQLFVGLQGAKSPTIMIELKGDLFRGTRVQLTMDSGKLSLKFESPDPNLRRLISSSKGELERALESKGLRLSRLEVNERE